MRTANERATPRHQHHGAATASNAELMSRYEEWLDENQRAWLRPLNASEKIIQAGLYYTNRTAMRLLFRLRVAGREKIPQQRPLIFTPNHTSSLDPFALAAALELDVLRNTYWAGRKGAVLRNVVRRRGSRLAQVVPVSRNRSALTAAAAALHRKKNLIWFPEGTRTTTGELQEFQSGVAVLMAHFLVPAIPIYIDGAYDAMPAPSKRLQRLTRITVSFGDPFSPPTGVDLDNKAQIRQIVDELHERVAELGKQPRFQQE